MFNLNANQRGIALMVAAMALYVVNDMFVKLTTRHFSPAQVLAIRGLFASALVVAIAINSGELRNARALTRRIVGLRCVLEVTTAATSIAALSLAPLASVTAVTMAAPLIITVASFVLGWERVVAGRVVAVLAGLAGAALVVKPVAGLDALDWGLVLALLCAVSLAARDLVTRKIPPNVPSVLLALITTVAVCVAGFVFSSVETWPALARAETAILALAAVCAALGNYALIAACRGVDLSVVTPFRYSIIVWALILGFMVWGDTPDALSLLGIALICGAGVHSLRAARRAQRTGL